MSALTLLATTPLTRQPWFWEAASVTVAVLLLLNFFLLAFVYVRGLREHLRRGRVTQFKQGFAQTLDELQSKHPDEGRLRQQVAGLDELERPIAAAMLIERLREASPDGRTRILGMLREIGAFDELLRSCRRSMPWRRALAVRVLGLAGAEEAVPELIGRLSDRNRSVREAAVRALGRIGDRRALPALKELFDRPERAAPGLVYEALVAFGAASEEVFRNGQRSENVHVRVASVFGCAAVLEPDAARRSIEPMLADESGQVRAAAAQLLGRIGGDQVPEGLSGALRDEQLGVRRAATSALAGYGDPRAAKLAVDALDDPDRDTALRAGEVLVLLERRDSVGSAAIEATSGLEAWPLETARTVSALERR